VMGLPTVAITWANCLVDGLETRSQTEWYQT
jgi:hypothetical protein